MTNNEGITPQQELFLYEIIKGTTATDAFQKAYPKKTASWKRSSITTEASKLLSKPKIQAKYQELLEEFRQREREKTGWTREQSIETLRFVIDTNRKDIERIIQTSEEELIQLQKDIQEHPELARDLIQVMINQKKRARATITNNNALIAATAELNKMQGYNEQNINMNGTVVFAGEDELED